MKLPSITRRNIKIDWVDLSESIHGGDWEEGNPEEEAMLRFDVYSRKRKNAPWEPVEDASYCTLVPATTPRPILNKLLEYLMDEYEPAIVGGWSVKKLGERLSWINPDWIKK
jgi:hypothetical protein